MTIQINPETYPALVRPEYVLAHWPTRCEACGAMLDPGHACGLTYEQMAGLCAEQREKVTELVEELERVRTAYEGCSDALCDAWRQLAAVQK